MPSLTRVMTIGLLAWMVVAVAVAVLRAVVFAAVGEIGSGRSGIDWTAVLLSLPGTIAALTAAWVTIRSRAVIEKVHEQTNSLLKERDEAKKAEGVLGEKERVAQDEATKALGAAEEKAHQREKGTP